MRIISFILFVLLALPSFGQYRDVRMPEQPKGSNYRDYTSQEQGFWCAVETEGGSSIMEHKTNMQYVNLTFTGWLSHKRVFALRCRFWRQDVC